MELPISKSYVSPEKFAADFIELAEVAIRCIKEVNYVVIAGHIRRKLPTV